MTFEDTNRPFEQVRALQTPVTDLPTDTNGFLRRLLSVSLLLATATFVVMVLTMDVRRIPVLTINHRASGVVKKHWGQ